MGESCLAQLWVTIKGICCFKLTCSPSSGTNSYYKLMSHLLSGFSKLKEARKLASTASITQSGEGHTMGASIPVFNQVLQRSVKLLTLRKWPKEAGSMHKQYVLAEVS